MTEQLLEAISSGDYETYSYVYLTRFILADISSNALSFFFFVCVYDAAVEQENLRPAYNVVRTRGSGQFGRRHGISQILFRQR